MRDNKGGTMIFDLDVALNVDGNKFTGNIREVLKINENNLMDEFTKQPSTFAWFATLYEVASSQVEEKKFALEVLEANIDKELREVLGQGDKKVTEPMVSSAIQRDERIIKMNTELLQLSKQQGILKALVRALDQRSTMLVQLGSTKRQEHMLTDFSIDMKKVRSNN
jgi:hypothetical protein